MASYLITGASRGIGLAMAGILASKPASEVSVIFAAARTETDELKQLIAKSAGRVHLVNIDVTDYASVKQAAADVEKLLNGKGLDVLVNGVGIMNSTPEGIEHMYVLADHARKEADNGGPRTDLESTFVSNVTSAHLVTAAFLPLLKKGGLKKIANVYASASNTTPTYTGILTRPAPRPSAPLNCPSNTPSSPCQRTRSPKPR